MKLLVVKTSSLGDVVHTLPAVTDALTQDRGLVVDWAVEPGFADIVRLHPGVRRVWPTPLRRWRGRVLDPATWRAFAALRENLRAEAYDLVIDAQGLAKSALVARLAGARVAGFDRASARGGIVAGLYTHRHAVDRTQHAIDRVRLLFGAALGYRPDLDRFDAGIAVPSEPGRGEGRRALLLHGTTWPSKRWPAAQWQALAEALLARGFRPAVTFADPTEALTAEALASAVPQVEVIPRQPLAMLAPLIAGSALVVGVDTGLTHLAAALDRPTIALFASTAPGLTAPRGGRVTVLAATTPCAPCQKRQCPLVPAGTDPPCHATIGPARVLAAIEALGLTPAA